MASLGKRICHLLSGDLATSMTLTGIGAAHPKQLPARAANPFTFIANRGTT